MAPRPQCCLVRPSPGSSTASQLWITIRFEGPMRCGDLCCSLACAVALGRGSPSARHAEARNSADRAALLARELDNLLRPRPAWPVALRPGPIVRWWIRAMRRQPGGDHRHPAVGAPWLAILRSFLRLGPQVAVVGPAFGGTLQPSQRPAVALDAVLSVASGLHTRWRPTLSWRHMPAGIGGSGICARNAVLEVQRQAAGWAAAILTPGTEHGRRQK